jgi:hypothetical protein
MRFLKILALAGLTVLLAQCYPDGPEYIDELDIVYSNYDSKFNFGAKKTYAIPDKIVKIDETLIGGGTPNYVKDAYAVPMLNTIEQNLAKYGWTEVSVSDSPDVLVAPAAWEMTTYYYYDYWYYWDWWYGGYYPPGGWYYPYPVVEGYSSGSLLVTMVDPYDLTPNDKARVVWTFIVNGLLEGTTTEFTARYTRAINQAFTQSPYLKKQN